jgi:hypothetical protein
VAGYPPQLLSFYLPPLQRATFNDLRPYGSVFLHHRHPLRHHRHRPRHLICVPAYWSSLLLAHAHLALAPLLPCHCLRLLHKILILGAKILYQLRVRVYVFGYRVVERRQANHAVRCLQLVDTQPPDRNFAHFQLSFAVAVMQPHLKNQFLLLLLPQSGKFITLLQGR